MSGLGWVEHELGELRAHAARDWPVDHHALAWLGFGLGSGLAGDHHAVARRAASVAAAVGAAAEDERHLLPRVLRMRVEPHELLVRVRVPVPIQSMVGVEKRRAHKSSF